MASQEILINTWLKQAIKPDKRKIKAPNLRFDGNMLYVHDTVWLASIIKNNKDIAVLLNLSLTHPPLPVGITWIRPLPVGITWIKKLNTMITELTNFQFGPIHDKDKFSGGRCIIVPTPDNVGINMTHLNNILTICVDNLYSYINRGTKSKYYDYTNSKIEDVQIILDRLNLYKRINNITDPHPEKVVNQIVTLRMEGKLTETIDL